MILTLLKALALRWHGWLVFVCVCGVVQVEEGRVRKEEQELKQSELAFDTFLQEKITLKNIARIGCSEYIIIFFGHLPQPQR
jgi:hypothetical protein